MNYKSFFAVVGLMVYGSASLAQLTGMSPNVAFRGQQNFSTTISSAGLFIQSSSPSGNLYDIHLQQGGTSITLFDFWNSIFYDATVVDPDTVEVTGISIPQNAPYGDYDLHVSVGDVFFPWQNTVNYILPQALTIPQPDGAIQGHVFLDANLNGVEDPGEQPLANEYITLSPLPVTVTTDVMGNFSYGVPNGAYTVTWQVNPSNYKVLTTDSASYTMTISNDTSLNNNFGLAPSLTNITPNVGFPSSTVNVTITAKGIFDPSGPPQGNISYVRIYGGFSINASLATVFVVDSNTATATFNINGATPLGPYTLEVRTDGNLKVHLLPNAFNIVNNPYSLSGNVFIDINLNGIKDGADYGIANQRVSDGTGSYYYFSNANGDYLMDVPAGNYTVQWAPLPGSNYSLTSAPSYNATVPPNATGLDFGITSNSADYSCDVDLTMGLPRCFQSVLHTINYTNLGNLPFNGYLKFVKAPGVTFSSSNPAPSSVNGDTVIWNFSNIITGLNYQVLAYFIMPAAGTVVTGKAYIFALNGGGVVQQVDSSSVTKTVVCAYDPNDKGVVPEGVYPQHFTLHSDTLEYLVRFQNTGNDTAFKVVIIDYLDPNLDMTSFEVVSSSHSVSTEVKSNGEVWFTFADILLPDSNVNEPGSHGFVKYRIRPLTGLADGTEIHNTAYIIFDFNAPVVTNTTWNTLVTSIPTGIAWLHSDPGGVLLFPNPFDESATVIFPNPQSIPYVFELYDVQGKLLRSGMVYTDRFVLEKGTLQPGLYFFRLAQDGAGSGNRFNGKFVIR